MMKNIFLKILGAGALLLTAFFLFQPEGTSYDLREGKASLALKFRLPRGYEFTQGAPFSLESKSENPAVIDLLKTPGKDFSPFVSPYKIPLKTAAGQTVVTLKSRLFFCEKASAMCFQDTFETRIPITVARGGPSMRLYTWKVAPKPPQPASKTDLRPQTSDPS